jgi:integrase
MAGRSIHRLNALTVERKRRDGKYCDGGGLYLQVDGGSRSWVYRYKRAGLEHWVGLGPASIVTLTEARELAHEARKLRHAGGDPLAARRVRRLHDERTAKTFDQCVEGFLNAHRAEWKNPKHRQQWENTLKTYAAPVLGKLLVAGIDSNLVVRVIEPIWVTKNETASRLRGRIEAVLDWATVKKYRTGDNPARWAGHLEYLLPARAKVHTVKHHEALPYVQMAEFMPKLRQAEGVAARALEFLILNACRTGDIIGNDRDDRPPMRWIDVDLELQLWTIPKTKTDVEHVVPLTDSAVALLEEIKALKLTGEIVFPATTRWNNSRGEPMSNGAMLALLRRLGANVTTHGFRATFKTWAEQETNFETKVIEAVLAHGIISSKLEAAYRRGDFFEKRKRLMAAWASFLTAAPTGAKVVALR